MNIVEFGTEKYKDVIKKIANDIFNRRMFAVFGAGLTIGEKTNFGETVPSGKDFMDFMKDNILKYTQDYPEDELDELEFYELSSIYFEVMDHNSINNKDIFKKKFTNIFLDRSSPKYNFLNLNWKTIYTLNIDDAIENNTDFKTIITPDISFNHADIEDYKSVIKLHGDAKYNILDTNKNIEDSIVFSKEIYLKALLENKIILSYFVTEMSRLNTLYYGCSFESLEIDIEGIIASERETIQNDPSLKRYFVTTKLPTKQTKKRKLEKDLLITDVIILKERKNYDIFLQDIVDEYNYVSYETSKQIAIYDEFKLNVYQLENNDATREENTKLLLGMESVYRYNDYETSKFYLPYFTIERDIKKDFISEFSQKTISILKGRKVSGKSIFLLDAFKNYANKDTYYIPSTIDISLSAIENMINTFKDAIIILDSNSFTYKHLWLIKNKIYLLMEKNINIILVFNSLNNTTLGSFYAEFKSEEYNEYELNNVLSDTEIEKINIKLDQIPLAKFQNYIIVKNDFIEAKRKHNILDNIIRINITSYSDKEYIDWEKYEIKNIKEFALLFILSTLNKFNLSSYYLVYGGMKEIQRIIKKYNPFIEEEYLSRYEKDQFSGTKIISNCQVCLIYILSTALENNILSADEVADELSRIIGKLYRNKIEKYQELLFFDNLHENLQGRHKKAFQKIVIKLYKKLEHELTSDKHYWIQRAKSILYLQSNDIDAVKNGLRFSTKVYTDEVSKESKVSGYAAHITAMLYGRLISLENYENIDNIESAINYYYIIFEEYSWNTKYIKNMVKRNEKNDLKELCFNYNDAFLNMEYKEKLKIIRNRYRELV